MSTDKAAKLAEMKARHEKEIKTLEAEFALKHKVLEALDYCPTTCTLSSSYVPPSLGANYVMPSTLKAIFEKAMQAGIVVPFVYGESKGYTHSLPVECLAKGGYEEELAVKWPNRVLRLEAGTSGYSSASFYVKLDGEIVRLSFNLFKLLEQRQSKLTFNIRSEGKGVYSYFVPTLLQGYPHSFSDRGKGACTANFIFNPEQAQEVLEKLISLEGDAK